MDLKKQAKERLLLFGIACLSGCTNNYRPTGTKIQTTIFATPTASTTSYNSGVFPINNVIRDTFSPTSVLDVIGDGSGSLGTFCAPSSAASTSTTTTAACNCTFYYTNGTATQTVDSPVTYVEADLARCNYSSSIPASITTGVKIAIHVTSSDTYTNTLPFSFSGVGVTLDTSNISSFLKVIRYQCRDVISIPGILDSSVYDPFQSEDSHLTYPIDFYTTNLGRTIGLYVANTPSAKYGWNCPPIYAPNQYLTATALATFNSTYKMNMDVYSTAADGVNYKIYPPKAGVFDRSTFYVAKQASGIFSVPLNAVVAPNGTTPIISGTSTPPIGYGAAPVVAGTGESCTANNVTLPSGYHWVKVWLFRASLNQRNYFVPGPAGLGLSQLNIGGIACNPGDWPGGAGPVFAGCGLANYDSSVTGTTSSTRLGRSLSSYSLKNNGDLDNVTFPLADRVFGPDSLCVRFNNGGGPCVSGIGAGCSGEDVYNAAAPYVAPSATPVPNRDPMAVNTPGIGKLPTTTDIGTASLETLLGIPSRFDYLFVVSPDTVMSTDMQNATTASQKYQPVRFYSSGDCLSENPNNPTRSGDCDSNNAITYGLVLHDVGQSSDPSATDSSRTGVFPICAIQPN